MNFQQRVGALVQLGEVLRETANQQDAPIIHKAYQFNPWFTPANVQQSFLAWADSLTAAKIGEWTSAYNLTAKPQQTIALIMAGNIPLVGLHDLLCVLLCGHKALVKVSEDDATLMKWVIGELIRMEPEMATMIEISEQRLPKDFDAVIATGSNNTNRYFEYYFRNKPSLLRANRNSVAIITGNETPEDYQKLGADIFTYFGLGCRNVSKLYVPEGFDFAHFYEGIESFYEIGNHHKYANNYTYHKALFLMNLEPHLDNNFVLVKEDEKIASPLGVMFYEYYADINVLLAQLKKRESEIQCMVCKTNLPGTLPLGKAQAPELWDYADGVDTIAFLQGL
jgi:hypothetical protein